MAKTKTCASKFLSRGNQRGHLRSLNFRGLYCPCNAGYWNSQYKQPRNLVYF